MNLKNKKIGVLSGGFSSEREISLRSGKNVYQILKNGGYDVELLDVGHNLSENLIKSKIEIAFNVLHGFFGEDGRVQAILDFMKIPYTGSGVEASAIAINKVITKQVVGIYGVKSALFKVVHEAKDFEEISFPYPWIIKPIDEGSSISIKILRNKEDWKDLDLKTKRFFVEQYIEGDEVTVGLLDNGKEIVVLPVLQLKPKNTFYDFEAKYTKGMTDFILPAQISEELTKGVQYQALKAHRAIRCVGATRSDFIIRGNDFFFLEINTNPGMTDTSDIPAQAKAYGLTDLELCEKILESSLAGKL